MGLVVFDLVKLLKINIIYYFSCVYGRCCVWICMGLFVFDLVKLLKISIYLS